MSEPLCLDSPDKHNTNSKRGVKLVHLLAQVAEVLIAQLTGKEAHRIRREQEKAKDSTGGEAFQPDHPPANNIGQIFAV